MFRIKIKEYREAISDLFGYKIGGETAQTNQKFRLTSEYSQNPKKEYLEFQRSNDDGTMSLVETDYIFDLDYNIQNFLSKFDSIPAFLSSITLDNLNNNY